MTLLIQLLLNGLIVGLMGNLIALSFGMIYRTTKILLISLASTYTLSAYIFYSLYKTNFVLAVFASIVSASLFSFLTDFLIYLPLQKRNGSSGVLLISSIGLNLIIINAISMIYGNEIKMISLNFGKAFSFGSFTLTKMQVIEGVLSTVILGLIYIVFRTIKTFKAIHALGENPELVASLGFPSRKLRYIAFMFSSILISCVAIMNAVDLGIDPHSGMSIFLAGAVAVMVGGIDNSIGWVISAMCISLIQSGFIWKFSSQWNDAITFTALILILIFRPQGLFSQTKRYEE